MRTPPDQVIPYDFLALRHFHHVMSTYTPIYVSSSPFYLPSNERETLSHNDYYQILQSSFDRNLSLGYNRLFGVYEEFTSGSTNIPRKCLRPSISWHLEFLRLRDILDYARA